MVDSKQQWKAWLYLSPALILLLVFTVWPIVNTVLMAFQENYNALAALAGTRYTWGLGNFTTVIKDPQFLLALRNTLLLCIPTVLLSTFLALVISGSDGFFGVGREDDIIIPWHKIECFGEDTILVRLSATDYSCCLCPRPKRKGLRF